MLYAFFEFGSSKERKRKRDSEKSPNKKNEETDRGTPNEVHFHLWAVSEQVSTAYILIRFFS